MPTKVGDFWSQTLNCRLVAPSLSFSCLSNSRMLAQCQECRVSGATGATAYTLTHLEWNKNSRSSYKKKGFFYQTQVEIPVTTADFYFPTQPRPLIVFVDGRVHVGKTQSIKDEELRTLLRKKGYRVQELFYNNYSDKKRDQLYLSILGCLGN